MDSAWTDATAIAHLRIDERLAILALSDALITHTVNRAQPDTEPVPHLSGWHFSFSIIASLGMIPIVI